MGYIVKLPGLILVIILLKHPLQLSRSCIYLKKTTLNAHTSLTTQVLLVSAKWSVKTTQGTSLHAHIRRENQ